MTRTLLATMILAAIVTPGHAADPQTAPDVPIGSSLESLPEHEGRNVTFAFCSPCHSMRLVAQQRLDRDGWEEVIDWMADEQGMVELLPETRQVVLDYLAWAFPVDRNAASR